jgi:hypothetical protein
MQSEFLAALEGIDWIKFVREYDKFKSRLPEQLKTLAMHGWFISRRTPIKAIYPLASLFQAGRIEEGHKALCWHFDQESPKIENGLIEDFPERAAIFKKAFGAHRANDCELSIPVFLAQADGIARSLVDPNKRMFSVYSRSEDRFAKPMNKFIEGCVNNELIRENLQVALRCIPLNASEGDPMITEEVLNRNAILHGTNTSYARFPNSHRALSWLEYVSGFRTFSRKLEING